MEKNIPSSLEKFVILQRATEADIEPLILESVSPIAYLSHLKVERTEASAEPSLHNITVAADLAIRASKKASDEGKVRDFAGSSSKSLSDEVL